MQLPSNGLQQMRCSGPHTQSRPLRSAGGECAPCCCVHIHDVIWFFAFQAVSQGRSLT